MEFQIRYALVVNCAIYFVSLPSAGRFFLGAPSDTDTNVAPPMEGLGPI